MKAIGSLWLVALVIGATALAACDAAPSTVAPNPTAGASALAARPGIRIDPTWKAVGGQWTFTGEVEPQGDPTDVVLEVGPGPINLRQFDHQVPVAHALTDSGPLTSTTAAIPDIPETNGAGTSSTTPLCFPHDAPPSTVGDNVPPATTFSAPATGSETVIKSTSFSVTWTEVETGSGISTRSLQRRVAVYTGGACGTYADDGPAVTSPSPVAVTGLLNGQCYEWVESLSDHAGMTTETTSGTVRVDL
jgi:hypothetical protein